MNQYANISKKLIVQALGRQGNYKEIITDKIDIEESGCLYCPYYIKNGGCSDKEKCCSSCDHKKYVIETKYINEKNRYHVNDTLRLKTNAIKLLLCLHFLSPDSNGIVKNVDLKELARDLHVNPKTIWNNINLLTDYGYIAWCRSYKGLINVLLIGYKEQREKHGPGYIVVNKEWMSHVLECKDIVTMRILIRETLHIDNQNHSGYLFNTKETSYHEMRRYLPGYCKPFIIKNAMERSSTILSGVFDTFVKGNTVKFTLKDTCAAKKNRDLQVKKNEQLLREFLKEYNSIINRSLTDTIEDERFAYLNEESSSISGIHITGSQTSNLAYLSLNYGIKEVENALITAHRYCTCAGEEMRNPGSLVRTIVENSKAYTA